MIETVSPAQRVLRWNSSLSVPGAIAVWMGLPANPPASEPGGFFFSWASSPSEIFPRTEFEKTLTAQTGAHPFSKARFDSKVTSSEIAFAARR